MPRLTDDVEKKNPTSEDVTLDQHDKALVDAIAKNFKDAVKDLKNISKNTADSARSISDFTEETEKIEQAVDRLLKNITDHNIKLDDREKLRDQLIQQETRNRELRNLRSVVDTLNATLKPLKLFKDQREFNRHIIENAYTPYPDGTIHRNTLADKERAVWDNFGTQFSQNMTKGLQNALKHAFGEINDAVNTTISKYAEYQAAINTRLQGSSKTFQSAERQLTQAVGIQPYFKTQSLLDNLQTLVGQGIAFNVEQRAFLETINDKIATTFDVANASLLRIVRLQQADSTAARLGMEAALTSYLNQMFEDTSYLNNQFDTVQGALLEASALMTTQSSVAFEYQVQKWLGSLSSLGMSDSTVASIGQALGYLGSGNISALSGTNMQNLLAIAANRAGLSYGSLIQSGLTESSTNMLLRAMVEYLQEIATSTNNAAKSEIAQQFGVTISDLVSAVSISSSMLDNLSSRSMSYAQDIAELNRQMYQVAGRTSVAGMLDTMYDNVFFSIASSIASNPALAATWKITDLIQKYTGGINIPTKELGSLITGAHSGAITGQVSGTYEGITPVYDTSWVDMETTVENLMKLGIIGIGTLGSIGDIISGLSSTLLPNTMLSKMGISSAIVSRRGLESTTIGSGLEALISGLTTSVSTYVGTTGSALYDSTMAAVEDMQRENQGSTKAPEETDKVQEQIDHLGSIDTTVASILTLLEGWGDNIESINTGVER